MREIGRKGKCTDMANLNGRMVPIMRETILKAKNRAEVCFVTLLGIFIMGIGRMVGNTARASFMTKTIMK